MNPFIIRTVITATLVSSWCQFYDLSLFIFSVKYVQFPAGFRGKSQVPQSYPHTLATGMYQGEKWFPRKQIFEIRNDWIKFLAFNVKFSGNDIFYLLL